MYLARSYFPVFIILIVLFVSCGNDPKVIGPAKTTGEAASSTPHTTQRQSQSSDAGEVHEVTVNDVLHSEKYTYLFVEEDGEEFWIAVSRMEAEKGERYFYTGGLLKRNFYSREFDRNFETIYLVSRITPAQKKSTDSGSALDQAMNKLNKDEIPEVDIEVPKDAVSLESLFANPGEYDGKSIKVHGQCVKINSAIMGRNWVHLQDGSTSDGKKLDLTITTEAMIPVGAVVSMQGTISLNRDFGSGYRYDVIMENASVAGN